MMKRTALLLLAVCTLLATAACAKNETEQPSGTLKATNDAVDFYFYYPDTWQVYLDKGTLEKTFSDYALEGESELKLDGVPAVRKEYRGSLTETAYRFVQVFCIRNGTIYQITFTANDADYERYITALDTIVTNFHFK